MDEKQKKLKCVSDVNLRHSGAKDCPTLLLCDHQTSPMCRYLRYFGHSQPTNPSLFWLLVQAYQVTEY